MSKINVINARVNNGAVRTLGHILLTCFKSAVIVVICVLVTIAALAFGANAAIAFGGSFSEQIANFGLDPVIATISMLGGISGAVSIVVPKYTWIGCNKLVDKSVVLATKIKEKKGVVGAKKDKQ